MGGEVVALAFSCISNCIKNQGEFNGWSVEEYELQDGRKTTVIDSTLSNLLVLKSANKREDGKVSTNNKIEINRISKAISCLGSSLRGNRQSQAQFNKSYGGVFISKLLSTHSHDFKILGRLMTLASDIISEYELLVIMGQELLPTEVSSESIQLEIQLMTDLITSFTGTTWCKSNLKLLSSQDQTIEELALLSLNTMLKYCEETYKKGTVEYGKMVRVIEQAEKRWDGDREMDKDWKMDMVKLASLVKNGGGGERDEEGLWAF